MIEETIDENQILASVRFLKHIQATLQLTQKSKKRIKPDAKNFEAAAVKFFDALLPELVSVPEAHAFYSAFRDVFAGGTLAGFFDEVDDIVLDAPEIDG